MEIELADFFERAIQCYGARWFERDDERQSGGWVARLLQNGVYVDSLPSEYRSYRSDNARAIFDDKAHLSEAL